MAAKKDISTYLRLQKQFSVLNDPILFSKNRKAETITEFLDEVEWAVHDNCGMPFEDIAELFDKIKELISEADTSIIHQSKKYL